MTKHEGGFLTAAAVLLSLAVVALGAFLLHSVTSSQAPDGVELAEKDDGLEPKSFDAYTWAELAEVAQLISSAPTDGDARVIAEKYGVSVGDTRSLALEDGRQVSVTVVGMRADTTAEGSLAGLTLMMSPISLQPMNSTDTNAGGWESSELRSWLAGEGRGLLPDELSDVLVTVVKRTNNVGVTSDASSVTETEDALWLFSGSEVCGTITWFVDEYGEEPNYHTGYVDFVPYDELLSSEGEQYEYFRDAGVTPSADPSGVLELAYGGSATSWWYRSSYPYTFTGDDASFFFQVMSSGYPATTGLASVPSGVTAGFCL